MQRSVTAIFVAVVGTTVLIGLKAPHGRSAVADTVAQGPLAPGPVASGTGTAAAPRGTVSARPSVAPPAGTPGPRSSATGKPGPGRTTAPPPPPPPPANRTIAGTRERAGGYGYVQVQIVLNGTRLVDVQTLEVTADQNSAARSAPGILRQEALSAQSANIANVSRATYTSNAYKASLQAALNKA